MCSGERGRAGAVLPPGEAAAAGGGGGGRSSRSGEVSSPPPPRNPSPPNATPRSSQLTGRRRAWGAAGPASPLRRRRGVSARCAVPCGAVRGRELGRRGRSCRPGSRRGAGCRTRGCSRGRAGRAASAPGVAPPRVVTRVRSAAGLAAGREGRGCGSPGGLGGERAAELGSPGAGRGLPGAEVRPRGP